MTNTRVRLGQNYLVINLGCALRTSDKPAIERGDRTRTDLGIPDERVNSGTEDLDTSSPLIPPSG